MRIAVHIGYHKCASTALQSWFERCPGLDYRFVSGSDPRRGKREILDELESEGCDAGKIRGELLSGFSGGRPVVLSHEELSGDIFGCSDTDWRLAARNLREAFPDARILIVTRRQEDYIRSLYAFRVSAKGEETRCFERFVSEEGAAGLFAKLDYAELAAFHVDLFGAGNVSIVPLEWLWEDFSRFAKEVAKSVGVEVVELGEFPTLNVGVKGVRVARAARFSNALFKVFHAPFGWCLPHRASSRIRFAYYGFKRMFFPVLDNVLGGARVPEPAVSADVLARWSACNASLSKRFGLDLKGLGYR
jgi:hypothetical protein